MPSLRYRSSRISFIACAAAISAAGALASAQGCGGTPETTGPGGGGSSSSSSSSSGTGAGGGGPTNDHPCGTAKPSAPLASSGKLMMPAGLPEALAQKAMSNAPEWVTLKDNVDQNMASLDPYATGPENIALVYQVTGDAQYAAAAYTWVAQTVLTADVSYDSYLEVGNLVRAAALVLDWCKPALSAAEKQSLVDFIDAALDELWFNNQGSGWAIDDPGNNYHMAFLEGTAFGGYALSNEGHPNAQKYLDVLTDKLEKAGGVMDYVRTKAAGGDYHEGAAYGMGSKIRLFHALAVVAAAGGKMYFDEADFFGETLCHLHYQLQPGNEYVYPGGDLPRDSANPVTPYHRDYVEVATFFVSNPTAKGYGAAILNDVVPSYNGVFNFRSGYYLDVLYKKATTPTAQSTLPLSYVTQGTKWVNVRTGWDAGATALSISAQPDRHQSHAHIDSGSFVMWKGGWQLADATTYSHSGLLQSAGAHNMVHVEGHVDYYEGDAPGLARAHDEAAFSYVSVDGSNQYRYVENGAIATMLDEYTREMVYLKPDTLVLYDRVSPKPAGQDYELRFHFPGQPSLQGDVVTATNEGGGVTLRALLKGTMGVEPDADLDDQGCTSFRLVEAPTGTISRFLNVLAVGSPGAPSLAAELVTGQGVDGADVMGWVVMFSAADKGAPAALPFSYTVMGAGPRKHLLTNMTGSVSVSVAPSGGGSLITVSSGADHAASPEGVVRFDTP